MTCEMAVLGKEGDTRIIWDPERPAEVEAAREQFNSLVKRKKYLAFSVRADGSQGEQIREFNPEAGKVILVPAFVGG